MKTIVLTRDQFAHLGKVYPQACQPMFFGNPYGNIAPYLPASLRDRELQAYAAAFQTDLSVKRPALVGSALDTAVKGIVETVGAQVGDDVAMLAPDANVAGREARLCEIVSLVFGEISKLPKAEAAALMRGLRGPAI